MRFAIPLRHPIETRALSLLRSLWDSILAVVLPTDCSLCQGELGSRSYGHVCPACFDGLLPWEGPHCKVCGLPFASERAADAAEPQCGECRVETPAFDSARSYGIYSGKLRQAVLRVKFSRDERLGVHLGKLLASAWERLPQVDDAAWIVPVPLHASRRKDRGFNQSDLLAEGLSHELAKTKVGAKIQVAKSLLLRQRPTSPQTGLSVSARRENLRGAFAVRNPESVRGHVIVLVDDVMTTGATMSACARTLKRAGARAVYGLTLARATPQFPDLTIADDDIPVDEFGGVSP